MSKVSPSLQWSAITVSISKSFPRAWGSTLYLGWHLDGRVSLWNRVHLSEQSKSILTCLRSPPSGHGGSTPHPGCFPGDKVPALLYHRTVQTSPETCESASNFWLFCIYISIDGEPLHNALMYPFWGIYLPTRRNLTLSPSIKRLIFCNTDWP